MNKLRDSLIQKISAVCERCTFSSDPRILKLRSPISRKGKGDSTYWSQCIEQFEQSRDGFEVICPNCLEIERLNKKSLKTGKGEFLPDKALIWNGPGFGQSHPWANEKAKEMTVLFIKGLDVYVYKQWNKPICNVDQLAYWFQVDVYKLTDATEAITLVR